MTLRRRLAFGLIVLLAVGIVGSGLTLWLQGYRVYIVHTGSMEPTYNPGDVIVDRPAPHHLRAGEVITFRHSDLTTDVVTHRVTGVAADGRIHTKGDANTSADVWEIRPDQVRGTVAFSVRRLGYVAAFLRQPAGIGSLATVVIAIALLWGLFFEEDPPAAEAVETPGRRRATRRFARPFPYLSRHSV